MKKDTDVRDLVVEIFKQEILSNPQLKSKLDGKDVYRSGIERVQEYPLKVLGSSKRIAGWSICCELKSACG